jgi:iron complex transport system substrate-binding protein
MKLRASIAALGLALAPAAAPAAEAAPLRVAALVPFVEDALIPLAPRVALVAAVRRDLHRPPAGGAADLGSPHSPSFERLAEARPELVVGDATLHAALRERLAIGGAEVMLLGSDGVDATFEGLLALGRRVVAEAELGRAVAQARRELESLALARPVATLALFGAPGSFFAVTRRAWLGDLLERLHFALAVEDEGADGQSRFPGLVPLADERLAMLRPELVLIVAHGDPAALRPEIDRRIAQGGPWRALGAASAGVHVLDPALFASNPGLGLPRAARALTELAPAHAAARE